MARAPWCSEEIYNAAAEFRDCCVRADGSLFTDRHIWTVEALQAIDTRVSLSDIGQGSWLDKLESQLDVLSADEILLGAELLFVLLLPQSDTHAKTKRKQLGRILAPSPRHPREPAHTRRHRHAVANAVFEDFLSTALRVALERRGGRVQSQYARRHLDEAGRIRLKPDITWWHEGACRAVIDAKYKALAVSGIPNADAYQMLAYCIAFELGRGYLVYAKDAGQGPLEHVVCDLGTTIRIYSIDVECEPAGVLRQIDALAQTIATDASPLLNPVM